MNYNEWVKDGFAVRTSFNGIVNRLITDVTIICKPELCSDEQPHVKKIKALWDTGASASSVDKQLAKEMCLVPIGKGIVSHANGQSIVNRYTFDFALHNAFVLNIPSASEGIFAGGDFQMIIGMDIIAHGDFFFGQYEKEGKPCSYFTFSIPCIDRKIDFVEELNSKRRASAQSYERIQRITSKKKKKR